MSRIVSFPISPSAFTIPKSRERAKKGGDFSILIDKDVFSASLQRLVKLGDMLLTELKPDDRRFIRQIEEQFHLLGKEKEVYQRYCRQVIEAFQNLEYSPGTVKAFFIGCFDPKRNPAIMPGCDPICIVSGVLPDGPLSTCDGNVVTLSSDGEMILYRKDKVTRPHVAYARRSMLGDASHNPDFRAKLTAEGITEVIFIDEDPMGSIKLVQQVTPQHHKQYNSGGWILIFLALLLLVVFFALVYRRRSYSK